MSPAARTRCKAVASSFGAGVVPGSLPNTKAGTRFIQQLSDVTGSPAPSGAGRLCFLGRKVNVILTRASSGEGALLKQRQYEPRQLARVRVLERRFGEPSATTIIEQLQPGRGFFARRDEVACRVLLEAFPVCASLCSKVFLGKWF